MRQARGLIIIIVALAIFAARGRFRKDDSDGLQTVGQAYLAGDFNKALSGVEKYLADNPQNALAWTIKGNILEGMDRDKEAEQAYRTALKLDDKNFQATNAMGILARKKGQYDQAMGFYRKALELQPGYAQAYTSMAVIELKRNKDAEALRLAKLAYMNDSKDPVIAANLAVIHHYNGNTKEREKYTVIARQLGYRKTHSLRRIYTGELTLRDE